MKIEGLNELVTSWAGKPFKLADGTELTLRVTLSELLSSFRPNGREASSNPGPVWRKLQSIEDSVDVTADEAQILEMVANQNAFGFPAPVMERVWHAL